MQYMRIYAYMFAYIYIYIYMYMHNSGLAECAERLHSHVLDYITAFTIPNFLGHHSVRHHLGQRAGASLAIHFAASDGWLDSKVK